MVFSYKIIKTIFMSRFSSKDDIWGLIRYVCLGSKQGDQDKQRCLGLFFSWKRKKTDGKLMELLAKFRGYLQV